MNPVTHDDLHKLQTRVDNQFATERQERNQAISGVRAEVMQTIQNLHSENRQWMQSISEKVDKLLEFKGFTSGAATGASTVAEKAGKFGGWLVATGIGILALIMRAYHL